jgi:hypothetical protein
MKLSRDGKCIAIALLMGEQVTTYKDKIVVVMDRREAFVVDRLEFDALEESQVITIDEHGCRLTGRGRVWAKKWAREVFGTTPADKVRAENQKIKSRRALRPQRRSR